MDPHRVGVACGGHRRPVRDRLRDPQQCLAHSAQNPLLVTLCTRTTEWTRHTRALSHRTPLGRRVSIHGHTAILRAVDAKDGPAAAAAMEQHLREVREISTGC
ncbi:FCD domain-containing protein [Nocardia rhizosphaerae]|uniref:FCD domain-containing protein n=1 Tax=Nocardia rhizosphaerae TaxID=1691571 RepID=A0ABV8L9H3_9NOCA